MVFDAKLVKVLKDCGRMSDDEKFVFERLIDAGDSGGNGELVVDKLDCGDGSFEVDSRNF